VGYLAPWIIGEVTFRRDGEGTHADLVLMPAAAFQPQPDILMQFRFAADTPPPAGGAAAKTAPPSVTRPWRSPGRRRLMPADHRRRLPGR
jgi:hypothetical protein